MYVPRLRCRLIDEKRYGPEELDRRSSPVAGLFRVEQSPDKREFNDIAARLLDTVEESGDLELWWVKEWLDVRFEQQGIDLSGARTPKEYKAMLEKRLEEWSRQEREEGRQEGREAGRQEGEAQLLMTMLEQKLGPLDEVSRMRVRSAAPDRLLERGKRILRAERLAEVFGD